MRRIEVDDDTCYWRTGAVQAKPHGMYAVGIQREVFLLCVGDCAGKNEHKAVRINRGFYRGFHVPGQDNLDGDVSAVPLNLELFNLRRAARRALRSTQGCQEQEHW